MASKFHIPPLTLSRIKGTLKLLDFEAVDIQTL